MHLHGFLSHVKEVGLTEYQETIEIGGAMGILSTAVSLLKLFFHEANYRESSKEWFDDVWEHLDKVSSGKGELYEDGGRIYRRFTASIGNERQIRITDDYDEGARIGDIKLSWWEKTRLEYSGSVVIQRYW